MSDYPVILYVEDDPHSCKVMRLLVLKQMGLSHLTIFEDSSDFIERAATLDPAPDIIFLDIHVKPYNGFEMLEMLRQEPRWDDVPIVALTASVMNEEVQRLQESGFNSCIAKPLHIETFPDLLSRILNGEAIWTVSN